MAYKVWSIIMVMIMTTMMIMMIVFWDRAFGYMDAETGLYPYTMNYQSVQVAFWPHILTNTSLCIVEPSNDQSGRIVRSNRVPHAVILDSGCSPCSTWKVPHYSFNLATFLLVLLSLFTSTSLFFIEDSSSLTKKELENSSVPYSIDLISEN